MMVEGLIVYFETLGPESQDRFQRAHLLAQASVQKDLSCLTAAWLANGYYNRRDFERMGLTLTSLIPDLQFAPPDALARAFLVIANACMYVRQPSNARNWYERARVAAVDAGDDATIGAIMFNRAAFALVNFRIANALGENVATAEFENLRLEAQSAFLYNEAVGNPALSYLLDVIRARMLMLQLDFNGAARLLHDQAILGRPLNVRSDNSTVRLEMAECLLELGQSDEARKFFDAVDVSEADGFDPDDEVVFITTYRRLCGMLGIAPQPELSTSLSKAIDRYMSCLREAQNALTSIPLEAI
jgi:hypothetical protein